MDYSLTVLLNILNSETLFCLKCNLKMQRSALNAVRQKRWLEVVTSMDFKVCFFSIWSSFNIMDV